MKVYFAALIVTCAVLCMLLSSVQAQPVLAIRSKICPVKINEVMVNPGSGDDDGEEYIELWNTSDSAVDISSWTIDDGEEVDTLTDYTGTHDLGESGLEIPPGGFALIVERDYDGDYNDYIEDYAGLQNFIMVRVDDYSIGSGLADSGDSIEIETDWPNIFIFGGTYQTKSYSWGTATQGPSIERDRYDSSTWMDSPDPEMGCTPCVVNSYI